ncbi:RNA polymerase subunit sigma-24, partial [Pseudomonas syringae pv. tagetis]
AADDLLLESWMSVCRALTENPVVHLLRFFFNTFCNLALYNLRGRRIHGRSLVEEVYRAGRESVVGLVGSAENAEHAKRLLECLR